MSIRGNDIRLDKYDESINLIPIVEPAPIVGKRIERSGDFFLPTLSSRMTVEDLIAEGRRLQRRTILLVPDGSGDPAAFWYGHRYDKVTTDGHRCWISVDAHFIPTFDGGGWLSIFTDDRSCQGGRVKVLSEPQSGDGVPLYAREIAVLPTIDAVIARGSEVVGRWLSDNGWPRDERYNSNFRDHAMVEKYEAVERQENPFFWKEAYATLGGWHMGWGDNDWYDLLDAKLLVHTYKDSEPWVEAWHMPSGEMKVIQRIS